MPWTEFICAVHFADSNAQAELRGFHTTGRRRRLSVPSKSLTPRGPVSARNRAFLFSPDGDRAVDALQARDSLKISSETAAKYWMAASLAKIADIAQLVEREPSKLNVVGSRPSVRSISGVPVSRHLREIEETIWRRVCWQPGFMASEM